MLCRTLWVAAAILFAVAPVYAAEETPPCADPAVVHAMLDKDQQNIGGRVFAINGQQAQSMADVIMLQGGRPPLADVSMLMVHRVNQWADIIMFVGNCARMRVLMPGTMFDRLAGQQA